MCDPQYLEKQKQEQKQVQEQARKEQSLNSRESVEMSRMEEAQNHEKRVKSLVDDIQAFGMQLQDNWDKEEKVVDKEVKYTLHTVAHGEETDSYDEKRSDTAVDLMDSLTDWEELIQSGQKLTPAEYFDKLYELAQASSNYCLTHDKLFFWTKKGRGRAMIARKVREMTSSYVFNMLEQKEKDAIYNNEGADFVPGETIETITKDLKRAAKAYKNYHLQIAKSCQGSNFGEMLDKRLRMLRVTEREIKKYRYEVAEKDRDPAINELIHEYEECLAWEKLRSLTRKEGEMEEGYDEMIDRHLEKEGEIESLGKGRIIPVDEKEALSKAQLKGIEEIDQWLLRNYRNGGVLGGIIPPLKNQDEGLVDSILSLSKRERLHIYYLVENQKRRDSNIIDVGLSQTYAPNLKAFKGQILASKGKFWKRLLGGYTYMDKLTDAFQVMKKYRKEIKAVAEFETEQKMEAKESKKKEVPTDPATKRFMKLVELKKALEALQEDAKNEQSAKNEKQKSMAAGKCVESNAYVKSLMEEIATLDESMESQEIFMTKSNTKEAEVKEITGNYKNLALIPGAGLTGLTSGNQFLWKKWNLKDTGWTETNLWTGSAGAAISGAVNLIGFVTSMITLCKTGDQMSWAEITEKGLDLTQSLTSAAGNALNIKYLVDTGGAIIKTTQQTQAKELLGKYVGTAGAVINAGITISRLAGTGKMLYHGHKAGNYFKQKREKLQKEGKDQLTKEKQRELKYEENMMKLQKNLMKREGTRVAYSAVATGCSVAGALFPPIGFISVAASIVTSITDAVHVQKIRTQLFDSFFNLDALAEEITKKRYAGNRQNRYYNNNKKKLPKQRVKEALRSRVAARAGFHNMRSAGVFICSQFARLIREKLFGEGTDETEKKAYIQFVKAINLRYNEKKGLPDEHTLVRKLNAE